MEKEKRFYITRETDTGNNYLAFISEKKRQGYKIVDEEYENILDDRYHAEIAEDHDLGYL